MDQWAYRANVDEVNEINDSINKNNAIFLPYTPH